MKNRVSLSIYINAIYIIHYTAYEYTYFYYFAFIMTYHIIVSASSVLFYGR